MMDKILVLVNKTNKTSTSNINKLEDLFGSGVFTVLVLHKLDKREVLKYVNNHDYIIKINDTSSFVLDIDDASDIVRRKIQSNIEYMKHNNADVFYLTKWNDRCDKRWDVRPVNARERDVRPVNARERDVRPVSFGERDVRPVNARERDIRDSDVQLCEYMPSCDQAVIYTRDIFLRIIDNEEYLNDAENRENINFLCNKYNMFNFDPMFATCKKDFEKLNQCFNNSDVPQDNSVIILLALVVIILLAILLVHKFFT